ncbi:MAG: ATP-binding protein [Polyangiaceae bacterium]
MTTQGESKNAWKNSSILKTPTTRSHATRLLLAFERESLGEHGRFVAELDQLIAEASDHEREYDVLQRVLSTLHDLFSTGGAPAIPLLIEAEQALASAMIADHARQHVALEVAYHRLLASGSCLTRAFDEVSLRASLTEVMPEMTDSAWIALPTSDSKHHLKPFFFLDCGKPVEVSSEPFLAKRLISEEHEWHRRERSRLVLPLTVENEYLGLALLELKPGLGIHEMLRTQISTALKTASLHQQIVRQTALHERSVQERIATAKRLQSLSVLAGGVAHDLNNALGPLVALPQIISDQLREVVLGTHGEVIFSDLELLEGAALRAAQTIKDLLTLGRQGQMPKDPLDLNRFTENALESDQLLKEFALRRGVIVTSTFASEPLFVSGSEGQLQRALSNLLRNAIDATSPGGKVHLRTFSRSLEKPLDAYETVEPGDYVVVEVSDTGCGIAQGDIGRVFEPFFSKKQLSENSGSGLGLAIVHGVVKEHEGYALVESNPGRGTTFSLYFPRIRHLESHGRSLSLPCPGVGRILIVDDDPVQLRTAKRVLAHHGYDVVTASNSSEAHRIHDGSTRADGRSGFDLVIVDMVLNEIDDGLALFARLQRLSSSNRGLVVSGNAPSERLSKAIGKGLVFLPKPYRATELLEAVQTALVNPIPAPITIAPASGSAPAAPWMTSDRSTDE